MTMILTHAVRDLFLRISRKSKAKTRAARALQLKDTQHVSNNEPYFGWFLRIFIIIFSVISKAATKRLQKIP